MDLMSPAAAFLRIFSRFCHDFYTSEIPLNILQYLILTKASARRQRTATDTAAVSRYLSMRYVAPALNAYSRHFCYITSNLKSALLDLRNWANRAAGRLNMALQLSPWPPFPSSRLFAAIRWPAPLSLVMRIRCGVQSKEKPKKKISSGLLSLKTRMYRACPRGIDSRYPHPLPFVSRKVRLTASLVRSLAPNSSTRSLCATGDALQKSGWPEMRIISRIDPVPRLRQPPALFLWLYAVPRGLANDPQEET